MAKYWKIIYPSAHTGMHWEIFWALFACFASCDSCNSEDKQQMMFWSLFGGNLQNLEYYDETR